MPILEDRTTGEVVVRGPRGAEFRFNSSGKIALDSLFSSGKNSTRQAWAGLWIDDGFPGSNLDDQDTWTLTFGAVERIYTFVETLDGADDILIGADYVETCSNVVLAFNGDEDSYGVKHNCATRAQEGFVASKEPPILAAAMVDPAGSAVFLTQEVPAEEPEFTSELSNEAGNVASVTGHEGDPGVFFLTGAFPDYILYMNVGNVLGEEWLNFALTGSEPPA